MHYRIITKHLLRGCFMISFLSYDNIIMIPKRRFIKKIEIRIFYESVFGFNAVFYDADFYLHLVSPNSGVQLGFLMPEHASTSVADLEAKDFYQSTGVFTMPPIGGTASTVHMT